MNGCHYGAECMRKVVPYRRIIRAVWYCEYLAEFSSRKKNPCPNQMTQYPALRSYQKSSGRLLILIGLVEYIRFSKGISC